MLTRVRGIIEAMKDFGKTGRRRQGGGERQQLEGFEACNTEDHLLLDV